MEYCAFLNADPNTQELCDIFKSLLPTKDNLNGALYSLRDLQALNKERLEKVKKQMEYILDGYNELYGVNSPFKDYKKSKYFMENEVDFQNEIILPFIESIKKNIKNISTEINLRDQRNTQYNYASTPAAFGKKSRKKRSEKSRKSKRKTRKSRKSKRSRKIITRK